MDLARDGMLVELQEAAARFLTADDALAKAYFTDAQPPIGVFTEQLAALQEKINTGLRRTGMSVLVKTITADQSNNAAPGQLSFDGVKLAFLVGCTPNANPSGLQPSAVSEKIAWVMKRFKFLGVTPEHLSSQLVPKQPGMEDQVHWICLFRMTNLRTATEPTR